MIAADVIGLRSSMGYIASPRLLALWRAVGGRAPFPVREPIAGRDGLPTAVFLATWRAITGGALEPSERIVDADGRPTPGFLRIATEAGL